MPDDGAAIKRVTGLEVTLLPELTTIRQKLGSETNAYDDFVILPRLFPRRQVVGNAGTHVCNPFKPSSLPPSISIQIKYRESGQSDNITFAICDAWVISMLAAFQQTSCRVPASLQIALCCTVGQNHCTPDFPKPPSAIGYF